MEDGISDSHIDSYIFLLTLQLPPMTKTESLFTISIQYLADKWWKSRTFIQYQIFQTNIIGVI